MAANSTANVGSAMVEPDSPPDAMLLAEREEGPALEERPLIGLRREPIPADFDELDRQFRATVDDWRQSYPRAAEALERFLDGSGETENYSRDELISIDWFRRAEEQNMERFENKTFLFTPETLEEVRGIEDGEAVHFEDHWDRDFGDEEYLEKVFLDGDFIRTFGRAKLESKGSFVARRKGDEIVIEGMVVHNFDDPYDFHLGQSGAPGALAMEQYRGAKSYDRKGSWQQGVTARVRVKERRGQRRFLLLDVEWGEPADVRAPAPDEAPR